MYKIEKSKNSFYKDKNTKSGVHTYCIECTRIIRNKWKQPTKEKQKQFGVNGKGLIQSLNGY